MARCAAAHACCAVQLLIHGTVPLGSGLSSSSALVVAVAAALLGAYGCSAPQEDVAAFACAAERYVGVNSGGMDQAISVMARPGAAPAPAACAVTRTCAMHVVHVAPCTRFSGRACPSHKCCGGRARLREHTARLTQCADTRVRGEGRWMMRAKTSRLQARLGEG
jgi:GHMP kinases N terminal domain